MSGDHSETMPRHRVLTEASGSLTSGYILGAIREAGFESVASDVTEECFAKHLADRFVLVPGCTDPGLWDALEAAIEQHSIDVVFPSFDETLLGWSERAAALSARGCNVIVSPPTTIRMFSDKWLTYQLFTANGLPTPATSLEQAYPLVKPRVGRGAQGVCVPSGPVEMAGRISQELLTGDEYTVDVLCDREGEPVYIVPRVRRSVVMGKSVVGETRRHDRIEELVRALCGAVTFHGPINVQCFELPDGTVKLTEVNPRLAGGMALGFAATENWVRLAVSHFVDGRPVQRGPVRYGLKMMRYYAEIFVSID